MSCYVFGNHKKPTKLFVFFHGFHMTESQCQDIALCLDPTALWIVPKNDFSFSHPLIFHPLAKKVTSMLFLYLKTQRPETLQEYEKTMTEMIHHPKYSKVIFNRPFYEETFLEQTFFEIDSIRKKFLTISETTVIGYSAGAGMALYFSIKEDVGCFVVSGNYPFIDYTRIVPLWPKKNKVCMLHVKNDVLHPLSISKMLQEKLEDAKFELEVCDKEGCNPFHVFKERLISKL